ncbi:hypothetical protein [uncultured Friedmanniella sp.]|uniref:hypothetical protein n=1 Tax=uncultured Friedmanniella sp. TaxID=335381 RepID=UPI0035CC155A
MSLRGVELAQPLPGSDSVREPVQHRVRARSGTATHAAPQPERAMVEGPGGPAR